uniref:Uncharacterized protein n=1 Tax=Anopheles farauti TaxID=69004 RepID=A0A182QA56_9DIPT
MPSSQGYSKVASEPPIEPVDINTSSISTTTTTAKAARMPAGGNVGSGGGAATAMMSTAPAGGGGIQSNPAGKIPATNSQQRLMPTDTDSVASSMDEAEMQVARRNQNGEETDTDTDTDTMASRSSMASAWFTVGVLCFVNLINYMDRFTIADESARAVQTKRVPEFVTEPR